MIWGRTNARREAVVPLRLRGEAGVELVVEAVIDTGFTAALTLPTSLCSSLGAIPDSVSDVRLADGTEMKLDLYRLDVWWAGRWKPILATCVETDILAGMRLLADCEVRIQVVPGGEVEVFPLPEPPI